MKTVKGLSNLAFKENTSTFPTPILQVFIQVFIVDYSNEQLELIKLWYLLPYYTYSYTFIVKWNTFVFDIVCTLVTQAFGTYLTWTIVQLNDSYQI